MKPLLAMLALLLALPVLAQSPDEHYVRIYQVIQEADRLLDSGQGRAAAAKYVEAQEALTRFRSIYPGWNERVINYRLNYVATKLAPLTQQIAGSAPAPGAPAQPGTPSAPGTTPAQPTASPSAGVFMSAEVENQIKTLQAEVTRLQADNQLLAAKLKEALSVQPAAVDPRELARAGERIRTLEKENELFKARLAARTNAPPPSETHPRIAEQNELIAALRTENEVLKKQSTDWQRKHDALASAGNTSRPEPAPRTDQQALVQKLSAENIALQKQIELWKQVASRPPATAAMPEEAQRELASLRARVNVLEAKPVPYTPEELALFAKGASVLTAAVNTASAPVTPVINARTEAAPRKVSRGVPVGAMGLVRLAERAFALGNYEEAALRYGELARQDENNVTTLGNLASAQLELGRVTEAEANVRRALELDPDDHFSLYVLGRIYFRQDKLDPALDALSRSAKANPDFADAQNYLGIVLSEKGLRGPAEAALRRAIQLQPDNPVAHNNLAVVYATQEPPALALARWHYQKAIAAGHARNQELEKLLGQNR